MHLRMKPVALIGDGVSIAIFAGISITVFIVWRGQGPSMFFLLMIPLSFMLLGAGRLFNHLITGVISTTDTGIEISARGVSRNISWAAIRQVKRRHGMQGGLVLELYPDGKCFIPSGIEKFHSLQELIVKKVNGLQSELPATQ
jgi:hypothetical protein